MNIEAIDKTIDAIRRHEELKIHFDMGSWQEHHTCGTSCCVAGFAVIAKRGTDHNLSSEEIERDAKIYLGLTTRQSISLFYPSTEEGNGFEAQVPDAIAVLEHLKNTGVADWNVANINPDTYLHITQRKPFD